MKVSDVICNVLQTGAAVELMNELVLATLISSRDTCVMERDRLNAIKVHRDFKPHEAEDWACLVFDIQALNRVIDYYGGK